MKNYMLMLLDQMIKQYGLRPPFLDFGCGKGDVALHLAKKHWEGTAIDSSPDAITIAREALKDHSRVTVQERTMPPEGALYDTILLWTVLEHVEDDHTLLQQLHKNLIHGGHLVLALPMHTREWRWDDTFYGHFRRYDHETLRALLQKAGFDILAIWDYTFPIFWLMRRVYTRLKSSPPIMDAPESLTRHSATQSAWDIGGCGNTILSDFIWWKPVYLLQALFKTSCLGHEALILSRKSYTR